MVQSRVLAGSKLSPLPYLALLLLLAFGAMPAMAGPPFLTDDPEPVEFHHYELYTYGAFDHAGGATLSAAPGAEITYGAAHNLQVSIGMPLNWLHPDGFYGIGDVDLAAKYRFVQEEVRRPQVSFFPVFELPTGNRRLGLGNGAVSVRLPIWLQKSSGGWTTYGGGGYQTNRAPGMKDSLFAGWMVQRKIVERLTLGAEVYHQEAQSMGARQTTFADAGGGLVLRHNFSLLFMLGHTVTGETHTVGYLGLYRTWGK